MAAISIHEKIGLARVFGEKIQERLTTRDFRAMCDANKAEEPDSGVCHSHDYCDANIYMAEAWQEFFGQEFDGGDDIDLSIWNDAWEIAKAAQFFA